MTNPVGTFYGFYQEMLLFQQFYETKTTKTLTCKCGDERFFDQLPSLLTQPDLRWVWGEHQMVGEGDT